MAAKKRKKAGTKVKSLAVKNLSAKKAKGVKGGASAQASTIKKWE